MDSKTLKIPVAAQFEVNTLGPLDDSILQDAAKIGREDGKLIRRLVEAIDKPLLAVLSCRTREEFVETREKVWSNYFRALRSFGDTLARVVDSRQVELAGLKASEAIAEDLARFRGGLFSEEMAQQFEFSAWLISRIQAAGHKIAKLGQAEDREADIRLSSEFSSASAWGQFHYDCVLASMKFERPIDEGIQDSIRDGLRAWVNAAAIVEEALALRTGDNVGGEVEFIHAPWDEEDDDLLNESMKDVEKQLSNDV
jgi:hypothetical protein